MDFQQFIMFMNDRLLIVADEESDLIIICQTTIFSLEQPRFGDTLKI